MMRYGLRQRAIAAAFVGLAALPRSARGRRTPARRPKSTSRRPSCRACSARSATTPCPRDYAERPEPYAVARRDVARARAAHPRRARAQRISRDRPLRGDARRARSATRARRHPARKQFPQVRGLGRRRARLHAGDAVLGAADRHAATRTCSTSARTCATAARSCAITSTCEKGDVYRALGRYNGSLGRPEYPTAVMAAAQRYQTRPSVLAVQTVVHRSRCRSSRVVDAGVRAVIAGGSRHLPPARCTSARLSRRRELCRRACGDGEWLLRIEDVDTPRTRPGAADAILGDARATWLRVGRPGVASIAAHGEL